VNYLEPQPCFGCGALDADDLLCLRCQAPCGDCGAAMELVRPGKWQCNSCEAREAK
jgi:hypothetical protein